MGYRTEDWAQRQYDLREPRNWVDSSLRCEQCGLKTSRDDMIRLDGALICRDCVRDYCKGLYPDYGSEYIEEHAWEYYVDWWLKGLPRQEILKVVKTYYNFRKKEERPDSCWLQDALQEEQEFCLSSDDWTDFVRSHLTEKPPDLELF